MPNPTALEDNGNGTDDDLALLDDPKANTPPEDNGNTPDPEPTTTTTTDEGEGDDPPAAPPQRIPKVRFDEVNTEKNRLAAENATLLAALARLGLPAPGDAPAAAAPAPAAEPEFNLRAKLKARNEALATGDDELALTIDEEIESHRTKEATRIARKEVEQANQETTQRNAQDAMARVGAQVKTDYPQLDNKSAEVDEDACLYVLAKRDALIRAGKPAHEALREAADLAAVRFGFSKASTGDPTPTASAQTARTVAARTVAAKAASAQAPDLAGIGNRASKTAAENVETMTDAQFAALPEAEKKRLRGDM